MTEKSTKDPILLFSDEDKWLIKKLIKFGYSEDIETTNWCDIWWWLIGNTTIGIWLSAVQEDNSVPMKFIVVEEVGKDYVKKFDVVGEEDRTDGIVRALKDVLLTVDIGKYIKNHE